MKPRFAITAGVYLLAMAAAAVAADERPNGFYLSTPLDISSGYDDRFVASSKQTDDLVTILTGPTFDWIRNTHRSSFTVNYQPEGELFDRDPRLDAWNHFATTRFSYRVNARTTFNTGDALLSTIDPTRQLESSVLLLPVGRFLQNAFYSEIVYRQSAVTKLTFRVDNTAAAMNIPGPMKGRLDNLTTAGTVTMDRLLTSRQTISLSYSYLHVSPLDAAFAGNSTNLHLLMAGYSYQLTPTVFFRATGGGAMGSQTALNGSVALEKQWGGMWLGAAFERYVGFYGGFTPATGPTAGVIAFANGVAPDAVYQVATLRGSGHLTRHIGLEALGQKALNGTDIFGRQIRSLVGQVKVSYKLTDRLTAYVRADHYGQNINEFAGIPMSRNRYFGGMEVMLSRPPVAEEPVRRRKTAAPDSDQAPAPEVQGPEERRNDNGNEEETGDGKPLGERQ